MPAWKLDLIFEARGRGWRETYAADFGTADFQGMQPFALKLGQARIAMAASPVQIKAYAVEDPLTSGRQGQTINFKPRLSAPAWPGDDGATDPSTAVNIGFINAITNKTRRIQLRGCPDGIVNDFGELTGPLYGAWEGKFLAWRQIMLGISQQGVSANYGWFSRVPLNVPAGKVTYTYAAGAVVPTYSFAANFFADDDVEKPRFVRIRRFNGGNSPLNGGQVVFVIDRQTAQPMTPIAAGPMTTPGLCQRYATLPSLVVASNIGVEKAGRRAPGAPLGYTPGRRRKRARS